MNKTVNYQARDFITKKIQYLKQFQLLTSIEIDENIGSLYCAKILSGYKNYPNAYTRLMYDIILSVGYLDTYKMVQYRLKNNTFQNEDIVMKAYLNQINNFQDLQSLVDSKPFLLEKLIRNSYQFSDLSGMGKRLVVKSLTDEEHQKLEEIVPMHQNDRTQYDTYVTADLIVSFYKSMEKISQERPYTKEDILTNICGFLTMLGTIDLENASDIIRSMIELDYHYFKYSELINIDFPEKQKAEMKARASFLEDEHFEMEDIIDNYLFYNPMFLKGLVGSYINIATNYDKEFITDMDAYMEDTVKQKLKKGEK